jgi:hypothetical protein
MFVDQSRKIKDRLQAIKKPAGAGFFIAAKTSKLSG